MRRIAAGLVILLLYTVVVAGYYFLPWNMRHPLFKVSPRLERSLHRQGFKVVETWDSFGLWGRDCRTTLAREGETHSFGGFPAQGLSLTGRAKLLENTSYTVGYSESKKNPLWVAYRVFDVPHLSAGKRPSRFRVDHRTSSEVSHDDYRGSGYDRGHMAPNFAIATRYGAYGQRESFLMSNVIPQTPSVNRHLWRDLEMRVARHYGRYFEEVWVVTGPVFTKPVRRLPSDVAIPSHYYKIILDQQKEDLRVLAFLVEARLPPYTRLKSRLVSVDEIERKTGLDFFPNLPEAAQQELESKAAGRLWPWHFTALRYAF